MIAVLGVHLRVNVMLMTYVSYVSRGKNRFDVWTWRWMCNVQAENRSILWNQCDSEIFAVYPYSDKGQSR